MSMLDVDVIRPGDGRYAATAQGWNLLHQHTPAEILLPRTREEVAACVESVVSRKAAFRIRSGGHDVNGYSSADDAVVINLRRLDSIRFSEDSAHAKIQPGVKLGKLYSTLARHKLVVPAGVCDNVAVGGHALGGGNGYLQRYLGASCDKVVALTMIDARGSVVRASADENPDLFWALRGAGNGNFGVVVEYTYETTRVDELSSFAAVWSWEEYDEVFGLWQNWAPFADPRLTSTFTLFQDSITAMGMFAGPKHELMDLLPDFLSNAPGQAGLAVEEHGGYDRALSGLMAHYTSGDSAVAHEHSVFAAVAAMSDLLDKDAMTVFKEAVRSSPGTSSAVFFSRGGQICAVPQDFNAYRYRTQLLEPMIRTTWADEDDRDACLRWVGDVYHRLKPNFQGVYKNWASAYVEPSMYQWYGEDLPRLVAVKRSIDPDDVFSHPQSIPVQVTTKHIKEWDLPQEVVDALRTQGSLAEHG